MRTLYVSDLDFTLLRSDATLSARTVEVVNQVIAAGHRFTCATARGYRSTMRVTAGLDLSLPLITYGGAVRCDPRSGSVDSVEPLPADAFEAITGVTECDARVEPILFAMVDGRDRVCWRASHTNEYVESFTARRRHDPRLFPLTGWDALAGAPVFYATLIGDRHEIDSVRRELRPALSGCFDTVGPDGYQPQQTWFEIMSARATKGAATSALADSIGADRIVAFGDNLNDVPLLERADHGCAVANAVPELVQVADEVIGANDDDGVARWLERNVLRIGGPEQARHPRYQ